MNQFYQFKSQADPWDLLYNVQNNACTVNVAIIDVINNKLNIGKTTYV